MRKIRCPHCAIVNLERFVTFPHCAGCGALLTQDEPRKTRWAAWKRPLGPILWATIVGSAAMAAVASLMLLDARRVPSGKIAVYGQVQRRLALGSTLSLSLVVDTIDSGSIAALEEVTLRLDKQFLRDFQMTQFDPKPLRQSQLGSGKYFFLGRLPPSGEINVRFRALRRGTHRLHATIQAEGQTSVEFTANKIIVESKASQALPTRPVKGEP